MTRRSGIPSRLRIASHAEAAFCRQAMQNGWTVRKRGWPDFLIEQEGRLYAVEVKRDAPVLKREQAEVMELLERAGVRCLVWTPKTGFLPLGDRRISVSGSTTGSKEQAALNPPQGSVARLRPGTPGTGLAYEPSERRHRTTGSGASTHDTPRGEARDSGDSKADGTAKQVGP